MGTILGGQLDGGGPGGAMRHWLRDAALGKGWYLYDDSPLTGVCLHLTRVPGHFRLLPHHDIDPSSDALIFAGPAAGAWLLRHDSDLLCLSGDGGDLRLSVSHNEGAAWTQQGIIDTTTVPATTRALLANLRPLACVRSRDGGTIYVIATAGAGIERLILRRTSGGTDNAAWKLDSRIDTRGDELPAIGFFDMQLRDTSFTLLVVDSGTGKLFDSIDDGLTWTQQMKALHVPDIDGVKQPDQLVNILRGVPLATVRSRDGGALYILVRGGGAPIGEPAGIFNSTIQDSQMGALVLRRTAAQAGAAVPTDPALRWTLASLRRVRGDRPTNGPVGIDNFGLDPIGGGYGMEFADATFTLTAGSGYAVAWWKSNDEMLTWLPVAAPGPSPWDVLL